METGENTTAQKRQTKAVCQILWDWRCTTLETETHQVRLTTRCWAVRFSRLWNDTNPNRGIQEQHTTFVHRLPKHRRRISAHAIRRFYLLSVQIHVGSLSFFPGSPPFEQFPNPYKDQDVWGLRETEHCEQKREPCNSNSNNIGSSVVEWARQTLDEVEFNWHGQRVQDCTVQI